VLIRDFVLRSGYWVLLKWYELIEKGDSMVVLRKKMTATPPPKELVAWYDKRLWDQRIPNITIRDLMMAVPEGMSYQNVSAAPRWLNRQQIQDVCR
jgi:hypothetical protein